MMLSAMILLALACDTWSGSEVLARARFVVDIPDGWEPAGMSICHGEPRGDRLQLQRTGGGYLPSISIVVDSRPPSNLSVDAIAEHDDGSYLKGAAAHTLRRLAPRLTVSGSRVVVRIVSGEHHRAMAYIDDGPRVVYAALDGASSAAVDTWLSEFLQVVRSYVHLR